MNPHNTYGRPTREGGLHIKTADGWRPLPDPWGTKPPIQTPALRSFRCYQDLGYKSYDDWIKRTL